MSKVFKYGAFILLLASIKISVKAQTQLEKDSLRLQPMVDSTIVLIRANENKLAIKLAEEILDEATKADNHAYMIEAHRLLFFNKGRLKSKPEYRNHALICYDLSKQHGDYNSAIICANNVALTYFNKSEYDSAEIYYKIAMETARDFYPQKYPVAISNMAFINGALDRRDEELGYYLLSLKVAEEHPEYENTLRVSAMAYSGLGDYYRSIGEFENAIENYNGKLKLAEENDLIEVKYEALYGLGRVYAHDDYCDFKKSEATYLIVAQDTNYLLRAYKQRAVMGLAELYIKEKKYSQSQELLKSAREYYKSMGSSDYVSNAETLLGEVYYEMGNFSASREWILQSVVSSRKNGLISREKRALYILYRLDSMEGKYKNAFLNFQRFKQIDDSLNNVSTRNKLNELQVQYETEQTTLQNESLISSLSLEELKSQRKNTVIISVGAVSLLLVVSMVIVYRNYTRKKRDHDIIASQATELRQLSDFKEGLTSMVVHDMKNPINSIIGFSRGTPDEKKMKKINQSGYNILNLVTNMLDIQRFEETRVEVVTEAVEGYRLVAEAGNEVHLLLQAKSLRFKNELPKGVVLDVEKALLDRVMINLLTNAIKYSKLGSEITIFPGESKGGFQEIIVRDEGDGISKEKLPYVFNKFWHKDARKSGLAPSTGLGLSFCKLAIEAHGGTIRVESVLSEGTSMIFTVPVSDQSVSVYVDTNQAGDEQNAEALSTSESKTLKGFLPQLNRLEVHEVSAINKLINELEEKGLNQRWINALQASVYQGDQRKYDELINDDPT